MRAAMNDELNQIEVFEGAWTGVRGVGVPDAWNAISRSVIGAAMRVHSSLGPGLPERVYAEALMVEFRKQGICFQNEVVITVEYDGMPVGDVRLDLLVEGVLVLELKAVEAVSDLHLAQLVSYLRAGRFALGLLLNFNVPRLKDGIYRRLNAPALPRTS